MLVVAAAAALPVEVPAGLVAVAAIVAPVHLPMGPGRRVHVVQVPVHDMLGVPDAPTPDVHVVRLPGAHYLLQHTAPAVPPIDVPVPVPEAQMPAVLV